jgi:hypothetical protein
MVTTESKVFEDQMMAAVQAVISERLEEECKKAILDAKKKVEESVAEIVASVSVRLLKQVSIEYMRNELIVHVKMETDNIPHRQPSNAVVNPDGG